MSIDLELSEAVYAFFAAHRDPMRAQSCRRGWPLAAQ
jgi:hypothetical protein